MLPAAPLTRPGHTGNTADVPAAPAHDTDGLRNWSYLFVTRAGVFERHYRVCPVCGPSPAAPDGGGPCAEGMRLAVATDTAQARIDILTAAIMMRGPLTELPE